MNKDLYQKKVEQTKELVALINEKKIAADIEAKDATEKTDEANKIADFCEKLLNQAAEEFKLVEPLILQAMKAVDSVKKSDLDNIRNIKNMNPKVEFVMEALLIFLKADSWKSPDLKLKPDQIPDPDEDNAPNKRSEYNIKDALIKKVNFSDTESILQNLKAYSDKQNLNKLKNEYAKNMDMLEIFLKKNTYNRDHVSKGANIIVGLYDFFGLMVKYVNDCREKIDKTLEKVEVAKAQRSEALEKKAEAVAKKEAVDKIVRELDETYKKRKR